MERPCSTNGAQMGVNPEYNAPQQWSTTYRFATCKGSEAYRAQAQANYSPMPPSHADGTPQPRFDQTNLIPNINSHARTIELMVHEALVTTDGLDPENNILTCAGVKIPHPEPYSGEPDLERFEVFVTGLLRWLSMNLLLGSEIGSTLAQLRYLSTCLQGNALEWYSHNVEHFSHLKHDWTLESALVRLQEHFLHMLTHQHASTSYETTQQGSGTVQDLLNRLNKFTAHMVQQPDEYTQQKCFLAALRELLCREVLTRGHTVEFSQMAELVLTAEKIEDAVHYDMGTQLVKAYGSSHAAPQQPIPQGVRANNPPRPPFPQGNRLRELDSRGQPTTVLTRPPTPRAGGYQPEAN